MKSKILVLLLTVTFAQKTFSQNQCNCSENIDFVAKQIEENSASFANQVIEYDRFSEYNKHKKHIQIIAKQIKTQKECLGIIQYYLSFLRDAHQKLYLTNDYYPFKSFNDSIDVKKFINGNVDNFPIKKMVTKGILGNWHYKDGTYSVQIQKNSQNGRKFVGVLLDTIRNNNQFLGNKGDLKIEIYKNYKDELYAVYWSFGQQPSSYKVEYNDDVLKLGRSLIFYRDNSKTKTSNQYKIPDSTYFEELSYQTNYLRINTFDFENKKNIDSILINKREKILSKDNLIIDVRNNGGGSDLSYYPLLPYIMDKKIYQNPIAASSIWVSKDNFQDYYNERYLYDVKTKQDSINADNEIEELRKYIGKFEPYEKTTSTVDSLLPFPKKVYVIQNRWDASSTEGFILTAKQSEKVKTFGENTGGFVSYGEWRKLDIPNLPAWISLTQKKMIFYDDSDFEMIGIKPEIELNPDEERNWIEIVKQEIEK